MTNVCEEKDKQNTFIYILGDVSNFLLDTSYDYKILNTTDIENIDYYSIIEEIEKCDKNILLYSNSLQYNTYLIINELINKLETNKKFNNLTVLYETDNINSIVKYNKNIKKIVNIIPNLDFLKTNYRDLFANKNLFKNTNYKVNDYIYRFIDAEKINEGWIDWYFNIPIEAHGRIKQYDNSCCWFATAFNMIIMSDKLKKFVKKHIENNNNKISFYDIKYSESIKNLFKNQLYNYNQLNSYNSAYIGYLSSSCIANCNNDIDEIVSKKTKIIHDGGYSVKAIDSIMRIIIDEQDYLFMSFVLEEDDDNKTVQDFGNFIENFNGKDSFDITEMSLSRFIEDKNNYYKIILLEFPTWEGENPKTSAIYKAPIKITLGYQVFVLCSAGLPIFDTSTEDSHAMAGVYNDNGSFIYESNNSPIIKCDWNNIINDICIDELKRNSEGFSTFAFGGMDALIYINQNELTDN